MTIRRALRSQSESRNWIRYSFSVGEENRVIWINGPFGIGKTTTARLLIGRIPGARIFDPEEVGYLLRDVMVHESVDDFQDWPLWRTLVVANMVEIINHTDSTLVTPMTVLRADYAEEIFTGLARRGMPTSSTPRRPRPIRSFVRCSISPGNRTYIELICSVKESACDLPTLT